jgi:hypothetical protein
LREVEIIAEEGGIVFGRKFALDRTTAMVVSVKWISAPNNCRYTLSRNRISQHELT